MEDMVSLLSDRDAYIDRFAEFIAGAPTSYHAVDASARALEAAGFVERSETEAWPGIDPAASVFVRRDGAIIAWRAGAEVTATSPVRVLGCHTDSPGLMLKPRADFTSHEWAQVGVEVYGGPLLTTWFDRDLALAGRIVSRSGKEHLLCTEALARVPMLAIHLDREVGSNLQVDRQRHTQPVVGMAATREPIFDTLAKAISVEVGGAFSSDEIAGADVRLVDTQPPARLGEDRELFAAPRLDNLSSVFAGLVALIESEVAPGEIAMLAAFDHEELGSSTRSGAAGPFLEDVLRRLREGLGATAEESARAMSASWCLSADAGHSVHPNYPEKHDPNVQPLAGQGPMLKVNANQRYASDAHGEALWSRCCDKAGVRSQVFVSNNGVPCGSTIGPLTATRLGMRTVDAGVPLLSMHSVRELAHVDDLHGLTRVVGAFFSGA